MWRSVWLGALTLALVMASASGAAAQADDVDEDEILGDVYIKMNLQFARVLVNGEPWEEHEFVGGGKTALVRKLPRDRESTIRLEPIEAGYAAVEVRVAEKDFKRSVKKQAKKRILTFEHRTSVTFSKAPEAPAASE